MAQLLLPLAEAVSYLHTQGVVHRDIKPGNVLLEQSPHPNPLPTGEGAGSDGTRSVPTTIPKLTDFGLAKSVASDTQHTRTGSHLGTPAYMAPELAGGTNPAIGPPADVYSFGVMLYELLAGVNPFAAATELETYRRHLQLEAPQLRARPDRKFPATWKRSASSASKNLPAVATPPQRLADDLRRFLDGTTVRARSLTVAECVTRWVHRNPALATFACACVVGLAAALSGISWHAWRLGELNADLPHRQAELLERAYVRDFYTAYEAASVNQNDQAQEVLLKYRSNVDGVRDPRSRMARSAGVHKGPETALHAAALRPRLER